MNDAQFEDLIKSLSTSAGRVTEVVHRVPANRWEEVIHTGDGAWTRRQLLGHMAANDLRQLVRIRIGAGVPQEGDDLAYAADLEVHDWNRARVAERAHHEIDGLLSEMAANRRSLLELLRSLTPAQRDGLMPFRGKPTPLAEMIPVLIGHLDDHAGELVAGLEPS